MNYFIIDRADYLDCYISKKRLNSGSCDNLLMIRISKDKKENFITRITKRIVEHLIFEYIEFKKQITMGSSRNFYSGPTSYDSEFEPTNTFGNVTSKMNILTRKTKGMSRFVRTEIGTEAIA